MVYTCRWGILATGWIAELFTGDLLLDPSTRSVSDVEHRVTAVASSSSREKAVDFIKKVGADKQEDGAVAPKAYGSYEAFVQDPDVDIVYIATPHSHHYQNVLLCLEAGKNVCCEKSFTVNEAQARHLIRVAKEKNLFLMEAVWIRFFPLMLEIKNVLHKQRVLGKILYAHSEFGMEISSDPKHRINNPDLAGGALLDLGIYSLTWQLALVHEDPDNNGQEPQVSSSILKGETGVDVYTTMVFNWPRLGIQTIATTNIAIKTHKAYCVLVQGEKGDLTIEWPASRPARYTLHLKDDKGEYTSPQVVEHPIPGQGMFWEADGCARALRDGHLESSFCPLATTVLSQKIMDTVRRGNNFAYPAELEAVRSDA
ncbi:hypothetical protein CBS101457_004962 [Exobasidium rhododendri]|nr:hypothetical protein CBS101457_004962 [Exobasidium rhododendri]